MSKTTAFDYWKGYRLTDLTKSKLIDIIIELRDKYETLYYAKPTQEGE